MTAIDTTVVPTRTRRSNCKRCGRLIRRIPADNYVKWFNLQNNWRCRPTADNPNQLHDPEETSEASD